MFVSVFFPPFSFYPTIVFHNFSLVILDSVSIGILNAAVGGDYEVIKDEKGFFVCVCVSIFSNVLKKCRLNANNTMLRCCIPRECSVSGVSVVVVVVIVILRLVCVETTVTCEWMANFDNAVMCEIALALLISFLCSSMNSVGSYKLLRKM